MTLHRKISTVSVPLSLLLFCAGLILSGCNSYTRQMVSLGGESNLGIRMVQDQKYDEAIVELERVIAEHPHIDGKPWYWLGVAKFYKGLYSQAAHDLERSFVAGNSVTGKGIVNPLLASAYNFLGLSYQGTGQHEKAVQAFENGLKWSQRAYSPDVRWRIPTGMGWSKYFMSDFHGAKQAFDQAISVTPGTEAQSLQTCYRGLAFVNLALGNDDAALASVDKAHASQDYDQNFDLALINLVRGQKEKALEHWGGAGSAGVLVQDYQEGGVAGAQIVEIESDGPAAGAGLTPGDIVKSMDGQPIVRARDFAARIAGFAPGKSVRIDILRNGSPLQKTLTVGSAEARMAKQALIAPVVKVRPIMLASTSAPPASPFPDQPELQLPPEDPSEGRPAQTALPEPSAPFEETVKKEPEITMDAVSVIPQEVPAGESFQVRIDLYAENQKNPDPKITVALHCAVSRDGKVLKQFDPEAFTVPNGGGETVTKTIRAGKTQGEYAVEIRLELEGKKAERSVTFSIK